MPYEGEADEPSRTAGVLPVQLGDEVVLFAVANRAVAAEGTAGGAAEHEHLAAEPAYGNMAELGSGCWPTSAWSRSARSCSTRSWGCTSPSAAATTSAGPWARRLLSARRRSSTSTALYIPQAQPRIAVNLVTLGYADGRNETIMANGAYLIF